MSIDPQTLEQLSALADGELGPDETRFLLRRLQAEPELAARWQRYHLARACLRHEPALLPDAAFAAAVAAQLDLQQPPLVGRSWLRNAVGGALAAGVAALALFSISTPPPDAGSGPVLTSVAPVRTGELELRQPVQRVSDQMWAPLPVSAPIDPQLEGYFLRHGGAAASAPRGGFLPYVYVVATPAGTAPVPLRGPAPPPAR
jgi:anti-sigma factor RsiW